MAILGVDISKASFHCCLIDGETRRASKFDNKSVGYRRVLKWLKAEGADDVHACMEATGPYWRGLANSLSAAGLRVSVVNPSRTAHYARSQLRRTKTDAVDAEMLGAGTDQDRTGISGTAENDGVLSRVQVIDRERAAHGERTG